jgi:hypothetical protein
MPVTTRYRESVNWTPSYSRMKYPAGQFFNYFTNYIGETKSISDNAHPNFRKIQRKGGVVLSDCAISRSSRSFTAGSGSNDQGYALEGDVMVLAGPAGPSSVKTAPSSMVSSSEQLLMKLYAKINSSGLVGGEFVAELGSTVGMIRRPFRGASELLMRMWKYRQKRVGKTIRSAAKASADAWLEYRYGWKPLIMDMDTIVQSSFRLFAENDQKRLVVRAGDGFTENVSGSWSAQGSTLGAGQTTSGTRSYTRECRIGVGVIYDIQSHSLSDKMAALFGTRARDVPATLWELTPYSFVVDWFVNVGDWLQMVTPSPGINVQGHWATSVTTIEETIAATFDGTVAHHWSGSLGSQTTKSFSLSRTCNQILPAHPVWKLNPISVLHQADAAALMLKPILGQLGAFRHGSDHATH